MSDIQDQIENIAEQIQGAFLQRMSGIRLDPDEAEMVYRATNTLAEVGILLVGAPDFLAAELAERKASALAVLANIGAAKGVVATRAMQDAAVAVFNGVLRSAIAVLVAA